MFDHCLPAGPFGCILADPPWRVKMWSEKGMGRSPDGKLPRHLQRQNNPERHYRTMSVEEIKEMPVQDIAADNCVLFLWTVDPLLPAALEVGEAWGFLYKTVGFYWAKTRREGSARHLLHDEPAHKLFPMGTGYWTRANPEMCLLFTRGAPKRLSTAVRKLLIAPRREHSRKPDEHYERIAQLVGGPYVELFARQARAGWTAWGAEMDRFAPLELGTACGEPARDETAA